MAARCFEISADLAGSRYACVRQGSLLKRQFLVFAGSVHRVAGRAGLLKLDLCKLAGWRSLGKSPGEPAILHFQRNSGLDGKLVVKVEPAECAIFQNSRLAVFFT